MAKMILEQIPDCVRTHFPGTNWSNVLRSVNGTLGRAETVEVKTKLNGVTHGDLATIKSTDKHKATVTGDDHTEFASLCFALAKVEKTIASLAESGVVCSRLALRDVPAGVEAMVRRHPITSDPATVSIIPATVSA
jgi:hypothetical protein